MCDEGAVNTPGKLLHPCEECAAANDHWKCLDQADAIMVFHSRHDADDQAAIHDAIGIQRQHLLVGATKAYHPVMQVSGFAVRILVTAAIENALMIASSLTESQKSPLFL